MTRFEEVARLTELEQKATPAPWNLDMQFDPQDVLRNVKLEIALRNAAPWLLEALACFQPGDADLLRWMRTAEGDAGDGTLEEVHDAIERLLIRMEKAAAIMEERE